MVTSTENLVKIGSVFSEIFSGVCPFAILSIVFGVTGQIFIRFAQNTAKILLSNIFESE